MDQKKIGMFLKTLRKEKGLTQEQLAEHFNVSGRTVSRWETGSNMPDLSLLVELADYYHLDIREIIDGERKGEKVNQVVNETLVKVAEYTDIEKKKIMDKNRRIIAWILFGFAIFVMISAMGIFPSDSSWGSIYSIIGSMILTCSVFILLKENKHRIICTVASFIVIICCLITVDYIGVRLGGQVPRFAYLKQYGDKEIVYKAPFYTVIRRNVDTNNEYIEIQ